MIVDGWVAIEPALAAVGAEVFVRAKFDVVWRLSELDESALAVGVHEANSWLSLHPFVHCRVCSNGSAAVMRCPGWCEQVCPFAGVGMRCRHDAESSASRFVVMTSVTPVVD